MPRKHVVLLVHGIRDYALWQTAIRRTLEEAGLEVEPTNYGRLGLIQFLFPLFGSRKRAVTVVSKQIRDAFKKHDGATFSIIAHSFGTYVVGRIIMEGFDVSLNKIVFCGSILPYDFPFEHLSERFSGDILNEVGSRDPWPAIAESVTWGFGSAGTYGFLRPRVRDRWHKNARHNYFLSADFCKCYWVPYLKYGTIVDPAGEEEQLLWVKVISNLHIKYLLLAIFVLVVFAFNWMAPPDMRHPYSPVNDSRDESQPLRPRVQGSITYVKWIDRADYEPVDPETGRYPNQQPNRSLSLQSIDGTGTQIWVEQNLLRVVGKRPFWQSPGRGGWMEIATDHSRIKEGRVGFLLRRQDPNEKCTASGGRRLLEAFIDRDLNIQGNSENMCYRWSEFPCSETQPMKLPLKSEPFDICVGPIVKVLRD